MSYDFTSFKKQLGDVETWLGHEFSSIRTGRAAPAILDNVKVSAYGSLMGLKEVAGVTAEDPRTLRVTPWDLTQSKTIEKGITDAGLGLSIVTDEKGLRVIFPELTSERREALKKLARQKLEEARVSLRLEREKIWEDIQKKEKAGGMAEDDKFRYKDEMQKLVDATNKSLEEMSERKEKEITS